MKSLIVLEKYFQKIPDYSSDGPCYYYLKNHIIVLGTK